jgi:outer membrane protein OmpA-like peptidoglycan-associated protein
MVNAADRAYEDTGDSLETRDWAYLAIRKTEIAESRARAAQQLACMARDKQALGAAAQSELEYAKERLATLEQRLEAQGKMNEEERRRLEELSKVAEVKQDERGTVVTLPGAVLFATGKSTLTSGAETQLRLVAKALHGQTSKITIEGHTDNRGSMDLNQNLSESRADAVKEYLTSQGIEADRIETKGYGESKPLMDNSSPASRAANRRVEIVVQRAIPVS